MRILFLSQLFDPENSIKGAKFLSKLKENDFEIEVVTTYPSYPLGKIFPEYKRQKLFMRDFIDGVEVIRLPTFINRSSSSIMRFLSYFSFGIVSFFYLFFFKKKYDVIYCYYPPVIGGLIGIIFKKIFKTPYIYDVQDLWPEALSAANKLKKNTFLYGLIEKLIKKIYFEAEHIIVLSNGFKEKLISKGIPSFKITRVYNWTNEDIRISEKHQSQKVDIFSNGKFNILYAGNIGPSQRLECILESAKILSEKYQNNNVHFWFLGGGLELDSLKNQVRYFKLQNVSFLSWVTPKVASTYMSSADALLAHLGNDEILEITIPQKLQSYMFHKKPILLGINGEASNLLKEFDFGINAKSCDVKSLTESILRLSNLDKDHLDNLGQNARNCYDSQMSMQVGIKTIRKLLDEFRLNNRS